MRKIKVFVLAMRDGADVTALFGGSRDRIDFLVEHAGDVGDDWRDAGDDLRKALRSYGEGIRLNPRS